MLLEKNSTIGSVVAENFRTAKIFENYGLDFCCGGKKTIDAACKEKGLNADEVINSLSNISGSDKSADHNFSEWNPSFLIDYIVNVHHTYVVNSMPVIMEHAAKVVNAHGERHPEVIKIFSLFKDVQEELNSHMMKEEKMLFPYIKRLADVFNNGKVTEFPPFGSINNPIRMMELEHENAGIILAEIRNLSNSLTPPEDACNTFRVLYGELNDFEKDLHKHIHLENNILFPKAVEMESSVKYQ
jgi:regulator of cell morphogenesis and NO signaling